MKPIQKVIKYMAIAFAIFLIVNIISAVIFGIHIFSGVLGLTKKEITNSNRITTNFESSDITILDIDLKYSNLMIKNGDTLKVESSSENINCKQKNNQLIIEEENHNWFYKNNKSELIVYIPENIKFDKVYIETGAGEIDIEDITTKDISLNMGAGKVEINYLKASQKAKIDGGVGSVNILDGEINNLDLDIGIGKFEITTKLTGNNKINSGIGKLDVNLKDEIENYTIDVDKGIGNISIDGKNVSDGTKYGNGDIRIELDGGIGEINIS